MKVKPFFTVVAVLTVLYLSAVPSSTASAARFDFPDPDGYVNDFADVLSDETEESLENELSAFDEAETTQILVITLNTLPETVTLESFVPYLTDDHPSWRAGTEEFDNGVIFTVVIDDRDMRIDTGYGVEGALPDAKARMILDYEVQPRFKEGDYDAGVKAGVKAIMEEVTGEYTASGQSSEIRSGSDTASELITVFISCCPMFLFILLPYSAAFLGRTKSWWLGGVVGFVGGLVFAGIVSNMAESIVGGIASFTVCPAVFGVVGLIFDFILSKNYKVRKNSGLSTGWLNSLGGFSSRGGPRGGFSGGSSGGFSSGGGSFGGGGASSGW